MCSSPFIILVALKLHQFHAAPTPGASPAISPIHYNQGKLSGFHPQLHKTTGICSPTAPRHKPRLYRVYPQQFFPAQENQGSLAEGQPLLFLCTSAVLQTAPSSRADGKNVLFLKNPLEQHLSEMIPWEESGSALETTHGSDRNRTCCPDGLGNPSHPFTDVPANPCADGNDISVLR